MTDKDLTYYLAPWVEHETIQRGRQASGVERYRRTVAMFISWLREKEKPLDPGKIVRADIDEYMKYLYFEAGNIKNSSRANKLSALRSYFRYLIYCGAIVRDPSRGIPTPKFQKTLPKILTTEQLRHIFSGPDETKIIGLRDKALLYTIYAAALRVGEVSGLKIENIVDHGSGGLRLNITGKGAKNRVLTIRSIPAKILRTWLTYRSTLTTDASAPVFIRIKGGMGEGLSDVTMNNILKKYAGRVGIGRSKAFVHKLRATCCTNLYDEGVKIYELMYFMGHSDPKTTMSYVAVSEKALRKTAISDKRFRDFEKDTNPGESED